MFYQWPKIPRNSLFENFYIVIRHLVFVTLIHFMYINTYGVCGTNVRPIFKKNIPYEFFNFFSSKNKIFDVFPRLGRNLEICSNLTCYA